MNNTHVSPSGIDLLANDIHDLIVEAHRSKNPVTTDDLCRRIVAKVEPLFESIACEIEAERDAADVVSDRVTGRVFTRPRWALPITKAALTEAAAIARAVLDGEQ